MTKKKNEVFESILKGLNEALEDAEKKNKSLKRTRRYYSVVPIKKYTPKQIKQIRHKINMTQKELALYMGVSIKTIEAWEKGTNTPSGSSSRILTMFELNNNLAKDYPFVK